MAILLDKIKTDKAPTKTWFLSNGSVVGEKNNFSNCDNSHFGFHKKNHKGSIKGHFYHVIIPSHIWFLRIGFSKF